MNERLNTRINIRPVDYKDDKVYWAELAPTASNTLEYTVHSGYYLGSYILGSALMHIVSLCDVTSCVVRHLKNNTVFYDEAEAQAYADKHNADKDKE